MAYRLDFALDLPDALRACMREELANASDRLGGRFDEDPVAAVHEARKSLKKARALLRVVRPGIGRRVFRRENGALRDAARLVSGARDADVLVATVAALAERHADAAVLEALRTELQGRAAASQADSQGGAGRAEAVGILDGVAARLEHWPLEECDWDTVVAGMERAYRVGRQAFAIVEAEPTVERLHDWRKRVKDLWYHQRLTGPAWPGVLDALAEQAHRLSEILGDDHDLAVLAELLGGAAATRPESVGPADTADLLEAITRRRAELLAEALELGARVYAERPGGFARRTRRYLEEARAEAVLAEAPMPDREIERKFLVNQLPADLEAYPCEPIEQGYVVLEGPSEVRVRRRDGRSVLTVKAGTGRVRLEEEFEIDERRFRALWPLSAGRRVAKTRYRMPGGGGLTIELDVYVGDLDGLVLAEVEFPSSRASDRYEPPDWFGPEVTDDLRYANRALAVDGVPACVSASATD